MGGPRRPQRDGAYLASVADKEEAPPLVVGGWRGGACLRRPGCRFLAFPTQGLNPSPWSSASVSSHPPFE